MSLDEKENLVSAGDELEHQALTQELEKVKRHDR